MKTTLKDLLHAINILGDDHNVLVEDIDCRAVVPPVKFTPEGLKRFEKALSATVEVEYKNDSYWGTYVSSDDEEAAEKAAQLLAYLAGYNCNESDFEKWFEGETAEMI